RSFFCVGDLKQAIYGWRGGNAAIFDHIERQLQLSEQHRQSLNVSYRSSQIVLDCVNTVFTDLDQNTALADGYVTTATQWQKGFESHTAHFDLPGHVLLRQTQISHFADDPDDDDDEHDDNTKRAPTSAANREHARCVAQHVADICR